MSIRAMSFGAVLWDIICSQEYIGGAPFNLIAHMAKLGCAASMLTRVGSDARGAKAMLEIEKLGIDSSFVQTDYRHPTAVTKVILTDSGEPSYEMENDSAFEFIEVDSRIIHQIKQWKPDVFCFGTIEQRSSITRESLYTLLQSDITKHVFFDVNIRIGFYPIEIIKQSLQFCNIVKLNDDEVKQISNLLYGELRSEEDFVRRLLNDFDILVVVITRGKDGCLVYDKEGRKILNKGLPIDVKDAVGAGDAFSAAFLYTYIKTQDIFESARRGNLLGAYVASQKGAIPDYSVQIKNIMSE